MSVRGLIQWLESTRSSRFTFHRAFPLKISLSLGIFRLTVRDSLSPMPACASLSTFHGGIDLTDLKNVLKIK